MRKTSRSAAKTLLADYAAMPTSPKPVVPEDKGAEVSHKDAERRDPTAASDSTTAVEIGGRVGPEPTRFARRHRQERDA